jgi:hypothetical protein
VLNTLLAIYQRVQKRSCNSNGCGTEGNRLEDIRPTLETAVDIDLEMLEGFGEALADLEKNEDRSLRTKTLSEYPFQYGFNQNLPIK